MNIHATISQDSVRRPFWLEIFGTDTVPVESPHPVMDGTHRLYYKLAVSELTQEQRTRLIRHLSEAWKLPSDEVARSIDNPENGVPILAEDVVIGPMNLNLFV